MASLETVTKLIAVMAEVYRVELTRGLIKTYHAILGDLSDDALSVACQIWMAESQWFPKPSEIRQRALNLTQPARASVDEAWTMVMRRAETHGLYYPLELDDPLAQEAAMLTGWRDICHTPLDQLGFVRRRFERIYEQLLERDETDRRMLPAARERLGQLNLRDAARLASGSASARTDD